MKDASAEKKKLAEDWKRAKEKLKAKINRRSWEDWLRPGSVDKELGRLFQQFCAKESSDENLNCWAYCEVFAGRRTWLVSSVPGSNRRAQLGFVYAYFGPKGREEVNCSGATWAKVKKLLDDPKLNVPSSALDDVKRDVANNLCDTLARFRYDAQTEAYMDQAAGHSLGAAWKRLFGGGKLKI